jgi:crossover junction endodeoxyribonuclease RuvC
VKVIGLDLSLASTGVASSLGWTERIRSKPHPRPLTRLRDIRDSVLDMVGTKADLVVLEGLAASREVGSLERTGLWYLVVESIDRRGIPWAAVAPTALKKYATGRGNAGKDEVLAAVIKRFPDYDVCGNDEADALVLMAMGADHLGEPMVAMPEVHRTALAKVRWPERGLGINVCAVDETGGA